MLTYRDMQIGMERVQDARRADAQCRLVEAAQGGLPAPGPFRALLARVGGWLVREPAPLRPPEETPDPARLSAD